MPRLTIGLRAARSAMSVLSLAAGLAFAGAVPAAEVPATVVWFQQEEAGIEPYRVRYIVTPRYMRSDDGLDAGDFLLFDRRERHIYSVARDNRTVLEIDGRGAQPDRPESLRFSVRERVDTQAPKVAGEAPLQLELVAGGKVCRTAVVVPGFLESARLALQEFSAALAVQQLRTLMRTPVELQTPCFLLRYLYASDFHLARGMLLADWNEAGERRTLSGYESGVGVDATLFEVPADFTRITPPGE